MKIGGNFLYMGAYNAKKVQSGVPVKEYELTENQKTQLINQMNEAAVKYKLFGEDYDYASISEEGKGFHLSDQVRNLEVIDLEEEMIKHNAQIAPELQKIDPDDPFMKNVGQQWLVFSEFLYNKGFYDDKSMSEARVLDRTLKGITECLDGLGIYQVYERKLVSGDQPLFGNISFSFNSMSMSSHAMRLELESAAAALHYYGENFIEDGGLREEFGKLVDAFHDHNKEMLKGYQSLEEKFDQVRQKYGFSKGWWNPKMMEVSCHLASVTHSEEEKEQYEKEISSLFDQVKQAPLKWDDVWRQMQSTFLDYVTKNSDKSEIRQRALEETGGIFERMEKMWSNMLKKEPPASLNIQA